MTFTNANQSDLGSVHQSSIMATLDHRIAVAKASHNQRLIAALEREYEQMTAIAQTVSFSQRLEKFWMSFSKTLYDWSRVHIEQTVDNNGQPSWYAYNPESGQSVLTQSEGEMHQWIKKSYWGQ